MNKDIKVGDKVLFNATSPQDLIGEGGIILEDLGSQRTILPHTFIIEDVNMWEVKLDKSGETGAYPEDWLDKII